MGHREEEAVQGWFYAIFPLVKLLHKSPVGSKSVRVGVL